MMKNWYDINNKTNESGAISIHDEIGLYGVSAADFINDLKAKSHLKSIELSIHSPGGNLLDGIAIYNALKNHPAKIFGSVKGIAASAASFVLMAADYISMPEDSFLMIHNAQGGVFGDSGNLREMADVMDKLQSSVVNIYQKRTGLDAGKITEMMAAETWMTATEAMQLGFNDHVTDKIGVTAKASIFNKHFKNMPFLGDPDTVNGIKNERDLELFLRESGISKSTATALVARAKAVLRSESDGSENQQLAAFTERLSRINIPKKLNT